MSGAILVVGGENESEIETTDSSSSAQGAGAKAFSRAPLACCEILGRSPLERTVARLVESGIERISILAEKSVAASLPAFHKNFEKIELKTVDDSLLGVAKTLEEYCDNGVDSAFILNASIYSDCDYLDFKEFHRERKQTVTRGFARDGNLDLWIVDCAKAQKIGIQSLLSQECNGSSSYCIRDYVNRLSEPADIRRLVVDAFQRRCGIRPEGQEIRPGVWAENDSEIHRRARIVAPAYIGRGTRVREDTLITRYSNIESRCQIDYGTVIEDSSVLSDSYVGIWLDVSHAVVSGSKLMNLARNVVLEISDPSIIRVNAAASKAAKREAAGAPKLAAFAASE